jgi:photosystem II stability/assembly factor-like uncharacterized protein
MFKMKKPLIFFLILIAFSVSNLNAQTGWSWQNPTVNGNMLLNLKMVNVNTGFACGDAGTIIKTTNSGATWTTLNSGTSKMLMCLDFVNANIGYASGRDGIILKTVDGGSSWDSINSGLTDRDLNNIQFLNTNTGYASGEEGKMLKTTDAGVTWVAQNTTTQTYLFSMHFIDENTGYASGNIAIVIKTTNGGATWTNIGNVPGGQAVLSMFFLNANTGFAGNTLSEVHRTTNGGTNWQEITLESDYYPSIEGLQFVNSTTGYAAGGASTFNTDYAYIFKTTDAGANWVRQYFTFDKYLTTINFANANTGFAAGLAGEMFKTTNGGVNWLPLKNSVTDYNFSAVHFPSDNTGYTVAYGKIVKTTNGGINWTLLTHPAPNNQSDGVFFADNNTGYMGGEFNNIWKTTNGGVNWTAQQPADFSMYHKFYFFNKDTGFAAGAQGKLSKTTNGGTTWTGYNMGTTWDFRDIEFANLSTGFAVGIQGLFRKTTDGGTTWVQKATPHATANYSEVAINGNLVIAVTESFGTIIRSTDLGETWTEIFPGSNLGLNTVELISPTIGFAAGVSGRIWKTTNAGLNWFIIPSGTTSAINDLFFPNPNSAFAVGTGGMILHSDNSGTFLSGTVKYNDNQALVTNGRVLALKLNKATNEVIVLGSGIIQANGQYDIPNLPPDTAYIAAYPNSTLDFVPTYYPSTIDWENAITVVPNGSVNNINIGVFRVNNTSAAGQISGGVFRSVVADTNVIDYAVVYAKLGGEFKGFASSISNGDYDVKNLVNATYEIHASRLGYQSQTFQYVHNNNTDSLNIFMSPLVTGISQNGSLIPSGYDLKQNYPNPFNPSTKIFFSIPKNAFVMLKVYDVTGRLMTTLMNDFQNAGNYTVDFNAGNLSSGIYFYTIEANGFTATRKMMLLK